MPKTISTTGKSSPAKRETYSFWLTRDLDGDVLSLQIKVWLARPIRSEIGIWNGPAFGEDLYSTWTIEQALAHVRTYPDDSRQCIHYHGDRERAAGEAVEGKS